MRGRMGFTVPLDILDVARFARHDFRRGRLIACGVR
jgi:hypothetical protein